MDEHGDEHLTWDDEPPALCITMNWPKYWRTINETKRTNEMNSFEHLETRVVLWHRDRNLIDGQHRRRTAHQTSRRGKRARNQHSTISAGD